jgi:hypothetical protein
MTCWLFARWHVSTQSRTRRSARLWRGVMALEKKIRDAGYVALAGGVIVLASYSGVVLLDGFDALEASLHRYNVRTYVALAPGLIITAVGMLAVKYQRK